ncbi:MAG TPA: pyruvate kinase [Candidatus Mcinerneyibacteriales bacterium]|nr:pyruvate kinase [Candidatus Mcinerneyibacteriales bacterium]
MFSKRKTKIIVSLGPASYDESILRELINMGTDLFRINFSHGDYATYRKLIRKIKDLSPEMPIMADLKGAELRKSCPAPLSFSKNDLLVLRFEGDPSSDGEFSLTGVSHLEDLLKPGVRVLIDDGNVELEITEVFSDRARLKALNPGTVLPGKSAHFPGVDIPFPLLTDKDKGDIAFSLEEGLDLIAASMIKSDKEIKAIRAMIPDHVSLIAKIEHPLAAQNIDAITEAADMILVARGDLGVQMPLTAIPVIQKNIIAAARKKGKPVIIATQMLESMREHPRATRAEVTDIATAIYDSVDALMLTGETAAGRYPLEAVRTLIEVAVTTEADIDYKSMKDKIPVDKMNISDAISYASIEAAVSLQAKAIICFTSSGTTALRVAKFRPPIPIISFTPNSHVSKKLAGVFGTSTITTCFYDNTDEMIEEARKILVHEGIAHPGDIFVITAGVPLGVKGTTNMIKIIEI